MTILKDMGIQQWRLRRSATEIQLDANPVVGSGERESSLAVDERQTEHSIWPKPPIDSKMVQEASYSSASTLEKAPNGVVSSPAIDPVDTVKPNKVKPEPARKLVSMPKPMPAPMPAPGLAPAPMPLTGVMSDTIETSTEFHAPEPLLEDYGYTDVAIELPSNDPVSAVVGSLANASWEDLYALVNSWQNCPTCGEDKSLLGHGDVNADWFFLSDAPSSPEVAQQYLFAGRSGLLFEAMLSALGMKRQSVYSTSLFKCVASDDMSVIPACDNILQRQIQLIQPKIIVTFGEFTAQTLLKANANLETLRTQDQRCINSKIVVVPTFTPAQMLDDSRLKSKVWADLKKAITIANMPV